MTLILNGTDNSATVPAVQGGTAGTSTGLYYPSTNQVAIATNGTQAVLVDASQNVTTTGSLNAPNTFGFKNRIINGGMVIDQRNAGTEVNPAVNAVYYLDRWYAVATVAGKFKIGQNAGSVTPPAGFTKYLGITSLSAYTPLGTSDAFGFRQIIEGNNVSDLGWGTASAQNITVSFWVRSSLTGTFSFNVGNNGFSRSYPTTYTINSANTWEYKTVTIPGDTTGTWATDNNAGIALTFILGYGSGYNATANVWNAGTGYSVAGTVNLMGTSGATFYITGVQVEKGSTATSFDYRDYGRELILCQRYYEKSFDQATVPAGNVGAGREVRVTYGDASGNHTVSSSFKVTKRGTPTVTVYGNAGSASVYVYNGSYVGGASFALSYTGNNTFDGYSFSYSASAISACLYSWTAASEL